MAATRFDILADQLCAVQSFITLYDTVQRPLSTKEQKALQAARKRRESLTRRLLEVAE